MTGEGDFRWSEVSDRKVAELVGMARGVLADGRLNDAEIAFLHKWLAAPGAGGKEHPLLGLLRQRIAEALSDGAIDDEERRDIADFITRLCRNDFEIGEVLKSTSLPLDDPPPKVRFDGAWFCFTGAFTYGPRAECEAAVAERGGKAGPLSRTTDYLVIGEYAMESWGQSNFGHKIEKAVELRAAGAKLKIVSEATWLDYL